MLQGSDNRFLRLFSALIMAAVITAAMLYGMNKFAITLRMRDPMRYFHITNVTIPKPTGPAKRPQAAELPPPRAPVDYGNQQRQQTQDETGVTAPPPPRVNTTGEPLHPPITPVVPPQESPDRDTPAKARSK